MLQSAIIYRRAFYSLSLRDSNFKYCPTSEEWRRAETMCEILKPFYTITNLISGSSYPTSNLYFGEIWKIECLIRSYLTSDDLLIQKMAESMKVKFDKYWSDYNVVLAFGAVLDPTKEFDYNGKGNKKSIVKKILCPLMEHNSHNIKKKKKKPLPRLKKEYVKSFIKSNDLTVKFIFLFYLTNVKSVILGINLISFN